MPTTEQEANQDVAVNDVAASEEAAESSVDLRAEEQEFYERLLRLAADFDDFRKRARNELVEAEKRGLEGLLLEVLPALEGLVVTLASADGTVGIDPQTTALLERVRLGHRQLSGALVKLRSSIPIHDNIFMSSLRKALGAYGTYSENFGSGLPTPPAPESKEG